MSEYNVNPSPLLANYNHTNNGSYPLIPIDELMSIRGSGNYNPAPIYPQTTDYGNAYSQVNKSPQFINTLNNSNYFGNSNLENSSNNLYVNPLGSIESIGSWNKNTNTTLKPPDGSNYEYYDEYQRWALNASRKSDPYLLPFLFSKINVKFIQDSTVEYVKKSRNITIETKQDTTNLLNIMLNNYILYYQSNGIFSDGLSPQSGPNTTLQSILGKLNKRIIEQYVKSVLSGLNMHDYYMRDISTLPTPLTRPVATDVKGSNVLGNVGPFENNHAFTKNVDSFNMRNSDPGVINSLMFGN